MNELPVAGGRTRPVQQLPEPNHFWIAYSSRTWRCTSRLFTDLANARLSGVPKGPIEREMPDLDVDEVEDLLYLPPVDRELEAARNELIGKLKEQRIPVLVELRPGDRPPPAGSHVIFDLLEPLLRGETEELGALPEGSSVVWPLIPGLTDHPETWEEGMTWLKSAKVRCVQPLVPELTPTIRRQLAEKYGDQAFDALFHREPPSEREFATLADRFGLEVFFERPATGHSPRQEVNRLLAAKLALAGELWHRLEKPVAAGQGLLRASRGAENSHHDLAGLARENNLKVLDWLDAHSLELLRQQAALNQSALLETLLCEYLDKPIPAWVKEMTPPEKERAVKVIEVPVGDDDEEEEEE